MNKAQLVDAVTARIGDRRTAAAAVNGVLDTIVGTVGAGESVAIIGFGVFEGRARAARTARNPRTGAAVAVPATTVPVFRPGAGFRAAVRAGAALPGVPFEPVAVAGGNGAARNGAAKNGAAKNGAGKKAARSAAKALVSAEVGGAATVGTPTTGTAARMVGAGRASAFVDDAPAGAPIKPARTGGKNGGKESGTKSGTKSGKESGKRGSAGKGPKGKRKAGKAGKVRKAS